MRTLSRIGVVSATLIITLPRMAMTIPAYALTAFLLSITCRRIPSQLTWIILVTACFATCYAAVSSIAEVSTTAFAIEWILILPMLAIATPSKLSWRPLPNAILISNSLILILSLANMTIEQNFPAKLPYLHFLPDYYGAMWGNGGVKIVTLAGYLCIAHGLLGCMSRRQRQLHLIVGSLNFIVPSYNIGIACGIFSLGTIGLIFARNKKTAVSTALILATAICIALPYASRRLEQMSGEFEDKYGHHPKIYGYLLLGDLFHRNPSLAITGTGLGNFSGTAAIWSSEELASIASHERPQIPGLKSSIYYRKHLGQPLGIAEKSPYAIASSINKPYSSFSTMIAEMGMILGPTVFLLFLRSILRIEAPEREKWSLAIFLIALFAIDNLHSNSLLWGILLISLRSIQQNAIEQASGKSLQAS